MYIKFCLNEGRSFICEGKMLKSLLENSNNKGFINVSLKASYWFK